MVFFYSKKCSLLQSIDTKNQAALARGRPFKLSQLDFRSDTYKKMHRAIPMALMYVEVALKNKFRKLRTIRSIDRAFFQLVFDRSSSSILSAKRLLPIPKIICIYLLNESGLPLRRQPTLLSTSPAVYRVGTCSQRELLRRDQPLR